MFISKMPQNSPTGIFNSALKRGTKGKGEGRSYVMAVWGMDTPVCWNALICQI